MPLRFGGEPDPGLFYDCIVTPVVWAIGVTIIIITTSITSAKK